MLLTILIIFTVFKINFIFCPNVDPLRATITCEDQRGFIKCHVILGTPVREVVRLLRSCGGRSRTSTYTERQIYRIYHEFTDIQQGIEPEDHQENCPATATDVQHEAQLREILNEDRSLNEHEMANMLGISQASVSRLMQRIGMVKVASRWVPHNLTEVEKQRRVEIVTDMINWHVTDVTFLDRIIAIDEAWLYSYDPKDPQSRKEWRYSNEPSHGSKLNFKFFQKLLVTSFFILGQPE